MFPKMVEQGDLDHGKTTVYDRGDIHKLCEADVLIGQGKTIGEACKQLGVTDKTYFRWRKSHSGLRIDQAKRMRELESENARLKKAVAELTIDKIILKEVAEGEF
jgi:transposase-like protein